MDNDRALIIGLGAIQAMLAFALAQDIQPLPSIVKLAVAIINVGLIFWLAATKSWADAKTP